MLGGRLLVWQVLYHGQCFANRKSALHGCRQIHRHALSVPSFCLIVFDALLFLSSILALFRLLFHFLFSFLSLLFITFSFSPFFSLFLSLFVFLPLFFPFELPFIPSFLHSPSLSPFYLYFFCNPLCPIYQFMKPSICVMKLPMDDTSTNFPAHLFSEVFTFSFLWYLWQTLSYAYCISWCYDSSRPHSHSGQTQNTPLKSLCLLFLI